MSTSGTELLTSQTPTSPYLSRLVWLAEQVDEVAGQLATMVDHDGVGADLTGEELAALRAAAAAARTVGGDLVLIATAAHQRAVHPPLRAEDARPDDRR